MPEKTVILHDVGRMIVEQEGGTVIITKRNPISETENDVTIIASNDLRRIVAALKD